MQQQETNWPPRPVLRDIPRLITTTNYYISAETEDSELEDAIG